MSMIKVKELSFSYPTSGDEIFDHVSFQMDTDWKLGFVGRNGRGKTTLLKLLMGEYEYEGEIETSAAFDYFPYPVERKERWTEEILSEVCPDAGEWQIRKEFSALGLEEDVLWRPFETLSNGEQTKALLAALFLKEGNFLLIDEPTNHLDAEARERAAAYLKRKKGFILVSHDRHFLDGCVDHILALNRTDIEVRSGNFSSWFQDFQCRQESELLKNERLKKDIRRLSQSSRRTAQWSDRVEASKIGAADKGYVGHKAAKMMKRAKAIEARREKAIEEKSELLKNREVSQELKLLPLSYRGERLAFFSELTVFYGGRQVCGPLNLEISRGERVVLDGRNGSGKSSLLKLLTGAGRPKGEQECCEGLSEEAADMLEYTGRLSIGSGLVISSVPQDTSFLKGSLKEFVKNSGIDESLFLAVLRKLDFERGQFEKNLEELSGGQKKKILIARSLCQQAHLYVWDEPLNFIDIYSRIQIERLILEFSPSMVLVEHDQAFRDAVATRVVKMERNPGTGKYR